MAARNDDAPIAGPPTKLLFATQPPASVTSDSIFASPPQVEVTDSKGVRAATWQDAIVLQAFSDASCSNPVVSGFVIPEGVVKASNGVSTFAGLKATVAPATFYLKASASGLTGICSSAISVTASTPTKLAFLLAPAGSQPAGLAFSTQPQVVVQDAAGNWVQTALSAVTLAAKSDSNCTVDAPGTLGVQSRTVIASGGLASFNGVEYNQSGTIYLHATGDGLVSACSQALVVQAGAPVKLSFFRQPSATAIAATAFQTTPIVEIQDATGNRVSSSTLAVTLTAWADASCAIPVSGTLAAALNPLPAVAGRAEFSNVTFTNKTRIYLRATAPGLPFTPPCSDAIEVAAGSPAKLVFVTQPPSSATSTVTFATQPKVEIQDAAGNRVENSVLGVTLESTADASCVTAASNPVNVATNPQPAVAGVASFAGVSYSAIGRVYLKATVSGQPSITRGCSTEVNVTPSATLSFNFAVQPSSTAQAATAFTVQPQVEVLDANFARVTSATPDVTLNVFSDSDCSIPAPGTLQASSNPQSAVSGLATFAGVGYSRTGTVYLKAQASGFVSKCSGAIAVGAGAASKLAFSTQPSSSVSAGATLAQQPAVEVHDAGGNLISSSTANITLSAFSDSTCSTPVSGSLSATALTVSASSGRATFAGTKLTAAGSVYLLATSGTLAAACSEAVNVAPGSAIELGFVTEPSTSAARGNTLAQQPQVAVKDANANTVAGGTFQVTMAAFTNAACTTAAPLGALAAASNPIATVAGIASFSGLSYSQVGQVYLRASASAGTLLSPCFGPVAISASNATKLKFQTPPAGSVTAGLAFASQPTVQAVDDANNVVSAASPTITLAAFSDDVCTLPATGSLSADALSVTASSGQATFSGVKYDKPGTFYVRAAAPGYLPACSLALNAASGSASKLVFSREASSLGQAGVAFATQPKVAIQDAGGNVILSATNTVTLAAFSDSACTSAVSTGTLQTTTALAAVAGEATFSGLTFTKTGVVYLKATSGALTAACSQGITLSAGQASKLSYLVNPSASGTSNQPLTVQPQVELRDANDNWVTNPSTPVQVSLSAHTDAACAVAAPGSLSASVNPQTAVGGVASFSGVVYDGTGNVYMKAAGTGLTSACFGPVAFSQGAATRVAFSTQPGASAQAGVAFAPQPVVQVRDASSNLVVSATNNVQLLAFTDPSCSVAASTGDVTFGSNPIPAVAGVASFGSATATKTGTFYLKAVSAGLTSDCSAAVNVTAGSATKVAFSTPPSNTGVAGTALAASPVVHIRDAANNLVSSSTAGVQLSMHTDATCATPAVGTLTPTAAVAATAGVVSFSNVSFTGAGTFYLKAASTGLASTCSDGIALSPASASKLSFLQNPSSSGSSGLPLAVQPQVVIQDANGNTVSAANDVVTLGFFQDATCATPAAGALSASSNPVSAVAGVSTFSGVGYVGTGTVYLKASAPSRTPQCSTAIVISAGNASKLAFVTHPSPSAVAGVAFGAQPQVEIVDSSNTRVTTATDAIQLTAFTDSGCSTPAVGTLSGGSTTTNAFSGLASFSGLRFNRTGTFHLKATGTGFTSTCSNAFVVGAGTVSKLTFSTQPSQNAQAGVAFGTQPAVDVEDSEGNRVTSASDNVTLTAHTDPTCSTVSSGTLTPASATAASGGRVSYTNAAFSKSGTLYLKASSGTLVTACSTAVSVTSGGATKVAFSQQPSSSASAGQAFAAQPVVQVQDAQGNVVSGAGDSVSLLVYSDAACSVSASSATLTASSNPVLASNGTATFVGVGYGVVGTFYLKAVSGSLTGECSNAVNVSAGNATRLTFSTQPHATGTAGTALATQPVVQTQDSGGNLVSSSAVVQLTAYSDSGCSTPATGNLNANTNPLTASSGVATFAGTRYSKAGTVHFKATATGFTSTCSNPVSVSPGAAHKVAYATQPSSLSQSGVAFPAQPILEIRDAQENVLTTATNDITIAAFTNSTCTTGASGTLSGTTTVSAVAGIAAFTDLSYSKAETIYLKASGTGVPNSMCSSALVVGAGTASKLAFGNAASLPTTAGAGAVFATQPQVDVLDDDNNRVSSGASVAVSLAAFTDASCTTPVSVPADLAVGGNPVNTVAGVANFTGVSFAKTGSVYLGASATALTKACFGPIAVSAGSGSRLSFSQLPSATATSGSLFTTQPRVEILDAGGNRVTASGASVSLSAFSDDTCSLPFAGTLTGTSATTTAGLATFSGVSFDKAGSLYL
ncbi:MAG: hypothetical protein IOD12_01110, partial [Silvanigrellales bacterium]|nr:hypothetical protein [Silvanigrellales bacterium]